MKFRDDQPGVASSRASRPRPRRVHRGPASQRGGIVPGSHQRGHRLREGFRPRPESAEDRRGHPGRRSGRASAALDVERAGSGLLVLELEDAPGARRARGERRQPLPWGATTCRSRRPATGPSWPCSTRVGAVAGRTPRAGPSTPRTSSAASGGALLPRPTGTRGSSRGRGEPAESGQLRAFEDDMKRVRAGVIRGPQGLRDPEGDRPDAPEIRALDGISMATISLSTGGTRRGSVVRRSMGAATTLERSLSGTSAWRGSTTTRRPASEEGAEAPPILNPAEGERPAGAAPRGRRWESAFARAPSWTDVVPQGRSCGVTWYDEAGRRAQGGAGRSGRLCPSAVPCRSARCALARGAGTALPRGDA